MHKFSLVHNRLFPTFDDLCENLHKIKDVVCHYISQTDYLIDNDDNIDIDYIGKLENINDDFNEICKLINIESFNLPHYNKKGTGSYKHIYSEKNKKIIEELYQDDIKNFNFNF